MTDMTGAELKPLLINTKQLKQILGVGDATLRYWVMHESAVILSVHNEETGKVSQIRLELPYARREAYLLMDSAEIVSNKEFYRQKH